MIWNEQSIARAVALQTLERKCVVLVENCNWTGHECDVLAVTTDLRVIDVEVKISRADLKADAKKDKWWRRARWGEGPPAPQAWPIKVWKHYYALPKEIWKPELLDCLPSKASGVLLLREGRGYDRYNEPLVVVECLRRATPNKDAERLTPAQAIDVARLANLRMWEAYKQRDVAVADAAAQRARARELQQEVA